MTYWTLTYNGTEKPLAAWGIKADLSLSFRNKEKDSLTLNTTEPFDPAAAQFAWSQPAILRRDRTFSGGVYSGGSIVFQGYIGEVRMSASGARQAIGYTIYGVWWLLERLIFKQTRQTFGGWRVPGQPLSGATLTTLFVAESYLGEDYQELMATGNYTLTEILNWANECYNPTKRGATSGRDNSQDVLAIGGIDCNVIFPKTRAQNVSCAECIVQVLRYFPTTVTWVDYTTTIPTLWLKDISNLSQVNITLATDQEKEVALAPRYERRLNGVIVCYKQVDTYDGQSYEILYKDVYPPATTDWTPDTLTHICELAGQKVTHIQATVAVLPLAPAFSATAATRAAFWTALDATLQDPLIDPASILVAAPSSVVDENGAAVNTSLFPNILLPGTAGAQSSQLYSWMQNTSPAGPVYWVHATISVTVSFNRYRDPGHNGVPTAATRVLNHRVILTNATSQTYSAVASLDTGEGVPPCYNGTTVTTTSVAYNLYNSLALLQYSGSIPFVAGASRADMSVGKILNATGPNHTFSGLLIQAVTMRPQTGEVTVEFGPAARLDAPALIELWRMTRVRTLYNLPSGRSSGAAPADSSIDQTATGHKENSTHSVPDYQGLVISAPVSS